MSHLLKLVYEASELHRRYQTVHEQVFGFSLRRLARFGGHGDQEPFAGTEQLATLGEELRGLKHRLENMPDCDLTKRRGREICLTLQEYTQALSASADLLNTICLRLAQEWQGEKEWRNYSATSYRQDRITYDDAIQHHKRLGKRLQELLSTF